MASRTKLTDAETLEQQGISLNNAESQTEIVVVMADFGYDSVVIAEGKAIQTETRQAYDLNKTEDDETSVLCSDNHFLKLAECGGKKVN